MSEPQKDDAPEDIRLELQYQGFPDAATIGSLAAFRDPKLVRSASWSDIRTKAGEGLTSAVAAALAFVRGQ